MPWEARASVFLKAAELLAGKYRPIINAATMLNQSKTVFQGRDRRRLRADRLPALQRLVHAPDIRRAARECAGDLGLRGVPAARGLRAGDHALQLHVDRRQPADQPGDDGQHRHLEAGVDRGSLRLPADGDAQGGGPARRRHQPGARKRGRDRRAGHEPPGSGRRALHGEHRRLPGDVEDGRHQHRGLPRLSAHRWRDRRQGLRLRPTPPPTPTRWRRA